MSNTVMALKARAKRLRSAITQQIEQNSPLQSISHSLSLELVAQEDGHPNWDTACALAQKHESQSVKEASHPAAAPQSFTAIIGRAGTGKTMLARSLILAQPPSRPILVLDWGGSYFGLCQYLAGNYSFARIQEEAKPHPKELTGQAPFAVLDFEHVKARPLEWGNSDQPNQHALILGTTGASKTNLSSHLVEYQEIQRISQIAQQCLEAKGLLVIDEIYNVHARFQVAQYIRPFLEAGCSIIVCAQADADLLPISDVISNSTIRRMSIRLD